MILDLLCLEEVASRYVLVMILDDQAGWNDTNVIYTGYSQLLFLTFHCSHGVISRD